MRLHIDHHSGEPIIRQAIEQIQLQIVRGELRPGDRLPSIRELARELQINPTTVVRIYNELAHAGAIVLKQGQGAFVAEPSVRLAPEAIRQTLARHARTLLVEGFRLGLTYAQIERLLAEEARDIQPDGGGGPPAKEREA